MKKRVLSLLLAIMLVLTFLPITTFDAFASTTYHINGVNVRYDDFSSSENECWVYANNIYKKIWGVNFNNSFTQSNNSLKYLSDSELTLTKDHLKAYVNNAALGSCLRICNSEYLHSHDGWGHSQIIVHKDTNGFTVLEGGLSAYPYCREKYYTWDEYMRIHGRYQYIKYIKWENPTYYSSDLSSYVTITFYPNGSTLPAPLTTRTINGINKDRGPGELIVFNSGSVANTNGYGTDIAIDSTGKVIGIRAYQDPNKLTIPNGGFVLSGNGDSSGWVKEIALGQYVAYDVDSMMAYVYADENSYLLNHKKVKSGSAIGTLPSLGLEGYNFIGWSTDPEGKNLINEAYTVTQALTLYAVWESITPSCEHINTNIIYTYLSCQEEGYVIYQCNDCGNQQTIVAPKVGHNYTDGLCIYCYQSHPDCINGHEFGAWTQNTINDIAPHISLCIKCQYTSYSQHDFYSTADYDGSYHVRYCTLCGAIYEEHEYRYIEGWAASCKNNSTGLKACNQCTLCDRLILNGEQARQEDLVIYPTHSVQHVEAQNPTCTTDGNIEYWYCTECNQTWLDKDCTLVALSTVSPSPGHVWDSGIVTNGNILYTCTVCHTTQTETAPQNPPTISIESARGSAGNTVTIQVFIENNPGIAFLSLSLQYDQSVLTLASKAINGEIISDLDHGTNLMWTSPYNSNANGLLCTLTFNISSNAVAGNYPISLIFREAYTEDEKKVSFSISNGSVQVFEYIYGDVNSDEIVDGRDVIKLRQYMANYNYDTGFSTVAVSAGADANGDGIINGLDVIKLRQYMANYNYDTGSSTVILGPTQ